MKLLAIGLLVVGLTSPTWTQSVQEPPEAYEGQRQHKEPPPGFYCSPTAKDKPHQCHCARMSTPTVDDPVCEFEAPREDPKCTVFCHPQRCMCPVACEKDGHVHHH